MSELPTYDLRDLPGEWREVHRGEDAAQLENEVAREVIDGHPLFNVAVRTVAVRKLLKEVIFWLPDQHQWAWVHLTWRVSKDPQWPSAVLAADWDDMVDAVYG